jgi:hypothetical protein
MLCLAGRLCPSHLHGTGPTPRLGQQPYLPRGSRAGSEESDHEPAVRRRPRSGAALADARGRHARGMRSIGRFIESAGCLNESILTSAAAIRPTGRTLGKYPGDMTLFDSGIMLSAIEG